MGRTIKPSQGLKGQYVFLKFGIIESLFFIMLVLASIMITDALFGNIFSWEILISINIVNISLIVTYFYYYKYKLRQRAIVDWIYYLFSKGRENVPEDYQI